jgi:hypothetical protein
MEVLPDHIRSLFFGTEELHGLRREGKGRVVCEVSQNKCLGSILVVRRKEYNWRKAEARKSPGTGNGGTIT